MFLFLTLFFLFIQHRSAPHPPLSSFFICPVSSLSLPQLLPPFVPPLDYSPLPQPIVSPQHLAFIRQQQQQLEQMNICLNNLLKQYQQLGFQFHAQSQELDRASSLLEQNKTTISSLENNLSERGQRVVNRELKKLELQHQQEQQHFDSLSSEHHQQIRLLEFQLSRAKSSIISLQKQLEEEKDFQFALQDMLYESLGISVKQYSDGTLSVVVDSEEEEEDEKYLDEQEERIKEKEKKDADAEQMIESMQRDAQEMFGRKGKRGKFRYRM